MEQQRADAHSADTPRPVAFVVGLDDLFRAAAGARLWGRAVPALQAPAASGGADFEVGATKNRRTESCQIAVFHQRHSRTDDSADDYSYFTPEPDCSVFICL